MSDIFGSSYTKIDDDIVNLDSSINTFNTNYVDSNSNLNTKLDSSFTFNTDIKLSLDQSITDLSNITTKIGDIKNKLNDDIDASNFLSNKSTIDGSFSAMEEAINTRNQNQKILETKLQNYNAIIESIANARTNRNYYMMIAWCIILFVVFTTTIIVVLESDNSMTSTSKIILFLFLFFAIYWIYNNVMAYINGYGNSFNIGEIVYSG